MTHELSLILVTLMAVIGLVGLVTWLKLPSFIALALASLFVGLCAGMRPPELASVFSQGMGNVLGSVAMVLGLGAVLGKLLAESGGGEQVATILMNFFGKSQPQWMLACAGLLIGLPVFFSVGLVILVPIVVVMAQQTRIPLLRLALPLVAGLSVAHGLVPPHPGPMAAVSLLGADVGKTLLYSLLIAIPTTILCGPLLGPFLAQRQTAELGGLALQLNPQMSSRNPPGFALALFTILLPVLLMLAGTVAGFSLTKDAAFRPWADFLSHPVIAMLAAVLFAGWSLGFARGFDQGQMLKFSEDCLAPLAQILLVIGAGGGFSQVLTHSGIGNAVAKLAADSQISPLLLGWLTAALIRTATGSATVAITAASGILAPIAMAMSGINRELLVVAMGAGSVALSHVNDGGFWLVKEYLNLSVTQTLRTWTVIETAISLTGLGFALALNRLL